MIKLTLWVMGIAAVTLAWAVVAAVSASRREAEFRSRPSTKRLEELADEIGTTT